MKPTQQSLLQQRHKFVISSEMKIGKKKTDAADHNEQHCRARQSSAWPSTWLDMMCGAGEDIIFSGGADEDVIFSGGASEEGNMALSESATEDFIPPSTVALKFPDHVSTFFTGSDSESEEDNNDLNNDTEEKTDGNSSLDELLGTLTAESESKPPRVPIAAHQKPIDETPKLDTVPKQLINVEVQELAAEPTNEDLKPKKVPRVRSLSLRKAALSKKNNTMDTNDKSGRETPTANIERAEGAAEPADKVSKPNMISRVRSMPMSLRKSDNTKNSNTTEANDKSGRETPNTDIESAEDEEINKPKEDSRQILEDLKRPFQYISSFRNPFSTSDRNGVDDTKTESGRGSVELAEDDVTVHKPSRRSVKDVYNTHAMSFQSKLSEPAWWKERWAKVLIIIVCVLLVTCAVMALVIGVVFAPEDGKTRFPWQQPDSQAGPQCFVDNLELRAAVIRYVRGGCGAGASICLDDSEQFGWPMGSWCVNPVTDMSSLFQGLHTFNEDISQWEVSQVTDMSRMFYKAEAFNQDLSDWNIGKVNTVAYMFYGASSFNSYISVWNTSSVTDMYSMFAHASSFNQPIGAWDTSSVTDTSSMFFNATSFDRNLCAWMNNFPFDNANGIFESSGCTFQDDPWLELRGPFCASSCVL